MSIADLKKKLTKAKSDARYVVTQADKTVKEVEAELKRASAKAQKLLGKK